MLERRARWLVAVLCALAIGAAGSCHKPPSAQTRSYYMARTGLSDAAALGCFNGTKSGRVTLFFGSPTTVAGTYGATLWGAPDLTISQISARVKEVVRGYAFCRTSSRYRLIIGVGTSNSTLDTRTDAWARAHGAAWSRGVEALANWAHGNYPGHVQIVGAWDVEPSWSTFAKAEQWMHGYDGNGGRRLLHVNSSADGCPLSGASNGPCNNGWNQQRVWHMAWQHDPSLPFPQIYTRSGTQADQWQLIDLWATTVARDGMYFYGSMTQYRACQQVGGCRGTNNTPHQGNDQLRWYLATDSRTRQDDVVGMTDMNWNT
jgi:hypothetical protein